MQRMFLLSNKKIMHRDFENGVFEVKNQNMQRHAKNEQN
jgi:hypothetical protein